MMMKETLLLVLLEVEVVKETLEGAEAETREAKAEVEVLSRDEVGIAGQGLEVFKSCKNDERSVLILFNQDDKK